MKTELRDRLLMQIAKNNLMTNVLGTVYGSTIYAAEGVWEIAYLRDSGALVEIEDAESFAAAVSNPDVSTVYVPGSAALTREIAERILRHTGHPKTIFWEV
jgi:hypothetical protein